MTDPPYADILVVDDRPENLLAMESLLEEPDLRIVKALSGREALALVLKHEIALVLLDVQMPEMDGFETAELLRSRQKTRSIPIIFVTAISKEERHVFQGYESGAVDYLFKPIDPMILKSKVRIFVDLHHQKKALEETTAKLETLNNTLEIQVSDKTRELQRKAEELERANHRLVEFDAMKSAFLSSVSHELRTPLTAIMGFAKLIDKDFLHHLAPLIPKNRDVERRCQRVHENLTVISNEGERLTRLINDVLDLNKIESGAVEWRDESVVVERAISRAVKTAAGEFGLKPEVRLLVAPMPGLPMIVVDRDKLHQVLVNLLNNAAKFTHSGSVMVRALVSSDGYLQIRVEDTGEGIPKAHQLRIFDRFQQIGGETLSDKPKGTGLGLAICREIVKHYRGRIWVESEPGMGSTFFIEFPITPAPTPQKERAFVAPLERRIASCLGKPLILVLDEEPAANAAMTQTLEKEGYVVARAFDGREGLERARSLRPDCIALDLCLPDMRGEEVIQELRREPELDGIPILVVSASPNTGNVGENARLSKPALPAQLLEQVASLLDNRI
jgi:signal transduction histidine kinase